MTTKPDNLALAGLGLDERPLLRIARILLADVYWDDDREGDYLAACQLKPKDFPYRELMDRPETPQVPDETRALIRIAGICGRIEQAWGESFYSVARRMLGPDGIDEEILEDLVPWIVYYTIMACIGQGPRRSRLARERCLPPVGPDELKGFPDDLDASPNENGMITRVFESRLSLS